MRCSSGHGARGGLAVLVVLVAGCGGEASGPPRPASVPGGWAAVREPGLAFARPAGFSPLTTKPRPVGERLLGFQRTASPGGLPSQVGVGVEDRVGSPLGAAVRLALEESRITLPGHRVLRRSAPEVPGGTAIRVDAEYESFERAPRRVRTVDVWVQTASGRRVNLFARGPAEDFERLGLDRIPATLRLR